MNRLVMAALLASATLAGLSGAAGAFQLTPPAPVSESRAGATVGKAPVQLAQAGDAATRILQLEEEIRSLNGRIEEMSFQLLQMQEQIRKFQEDNEFRFQELEKSGVRKSDAGPSTAGSQSDSVAQIITTPPDTSGGDIGLDSVGDLASNQASGGLAAPEQTLGSIELDSSGMPVGATFNDSASNSSALPGVDLPPATPGNAAGATASPDSGSQVASLGSENDVYQAAYGHVLSGDYAVAEGEFRDFISKFPNSARIADANFWLGEALYSQGNFNEAAKTFLNAHQAYGTSPKAPEMLLKLGMSMAALDDNATACAVLREVGTRYPKASRAVINKVASEQKRLSC
ncbi:tol-pal system protein YbgF [Ciceribacter sp. L1K23]|uniref:tol-pal system protein YbgF n=1 Tax=Ciceribacter sp. L1K23 TaxID=2820276 RepID=UPI001B8451B6|nr:tol-pal system protein YbgF [Ciceribacter sp. L1K23]MBR0558184.1 tol-pal system protein YbgF [Ciceribacter sp. L1K23]